MGESGLPGSVLEQARGVSSATLHEAAGRTGAFPSRVKPVSPRFHLSGPAYTVKCSLGDNLWLHRAIYQARRGDVLVVEAGGPNAAEYGYWGEIMTQAALARGLAGLVIDGGVRDCERLAASAFPVFSSSLCIRGTVKDAGSEGALDLPLTFGDAVVCPGDLVVGDADGVVAVPRAQAADILARAQERERKEASILERLKAGETTLDIYGFR